MTICFNCTLNGTTSLFSISSDTKKKKKKRQDFLFENGSGFKGFTKHLFSITGDPYIVFMKITEWIKIEII